MRNRMIIVLAVIICSVFNYINVNANEESLDLTDEIDFIGIDKSLDTSAKDNSFKDIYNDIVQNGAKNVFEMIIHNIGNNLTKELKENKSTIISVIFLAIMASLLTNFSDVFGNEHIKETAFYIIYLLMIALLLKSFYIMTSMASDVISDIIGFMKAVIPSYFIVVTVTNGVTSASYFYEIVMIFILVIEWSMLNIVIPAVNIFIVLQLVNNISDKDYLSKMISLLKSSINWILKFMIASVTGINVIQGLITPIADMVTRGTVYKTASAIPGIGNTIDSVTKIVIASGTLIKNGIGVAALVIIIIICIIPYLKLSIVSFVYKFTAASMQPLCDKRLVDGINGLAQALSLLTRIILTCGALFMLTIAIITAVTTYSAI